MLKPGDVPRCDEILHATIIAERMSMRIQFDADGDTDAGKVEIERAQNLRRQAIGLRKALEELTAPATEAT